MPGKHNKPTGYKMKYQGEQSAFPFKDSPMKVAPIVGAALYGAGRFGLRQAIKYAPRVVRGVRRALGKGPKGLITGPKQTLPAVSTKFTRTKAKIRGVRKKYQKPAMVTGTAYGIGTIKGGQKSKKSQIEDKMKITPTKPTTPKNGGSKVGGRKTYKQAYSDPKVTAKYKDKGGYKQFVKESEAWWKTAAGQKYAKKHKEFAHRIKK